MTKEASYQIDCACAKNLCQNFGRAMALPALPVPPGLPRLAKILGWPSKKMQRVKVRPMQPWQIRLNPPCTSNVAFFGLFWGGRGSLCGICHNHAARRPSFFLSYLPTPISTYLNGLEDRIPQQSHGRHHCLGDPMMIGDAQETTK